MKKILLFLIVFFGVFLFPQNCFAKSYTIDKADIDIQVNSNGSADISEKRTYTFSGQYSNGWWITGLKKACTNTKCDSLIIKDITVREANQIISHSVSDKDNQKTVTWHYSALNETKDFTVSYRVENFVNNYQDTAELYWQLIQTGWGVPTANLTATIHLPNPTADDRLKAWGHGPLSGEVSIVDNQTIVYQLDYVPADTFVESRVLFAKLPQVATENENAFDRIVQEEADYINETINGLDSSDSTAKTDYTAAIIGISIIGLLFMMRFIYWLLRWKKMGKDLPLPAINLSGSLHEPPSDLEPSLVEAILSPHYLPGENSLTATLLELCRRKYLKITQEEKKPLMGLFKRNPEIWFEVVGKNNSKIVLSKNEEKILNLLYLNNVQKRSKSEILKKLQSDSLASIHFQAWKSNFPKLLLEQGLLDTQSDKEKQRITIEIVLIIIGFVIFGFISNFIFIDSNNAVIVSVASVFMAVLYVIALTILYRFMDRLTPKGAVEKSSWLAFKKYLKDYAVTKRSPLESVIIWEKYIVYGTALGVSLKALSELPLKISDETKSSFVYLAAMNPGGTGINFSGISQGLGSVSRSFSSYGASGSGSHGGFSGGGGGGGMS